MTSDLITRLSKLEGPDREVDVEIHRLLFPKDSVFGHILPTYTASVDAAIALAERVLTGWRWRVGDSYANVWIDAKLDDMDFVGSHPVPAIALCIAILRAKEARRDPR